MFLSWSRIFFSISASVRVSSSGHHWSASPVFRMAISTVGRGFSLGWGEEKVLAHKAAAGKAPETTINPLTAGRWNAGARAWREGPSLSCLLLHLFPLSLFLCPAPQSNTPGRGSRECSCHLSLKAELPGDTKTSPDHNSAAFMTPGFSPKQKALCCSLRVSGSVRLISGVCYGGGSLDRIVWLVQLLSLGLGRRGGLSAPFSVQSQDPLIRETEGERRTKEGGCPRVLDAPSLWAAESVCSRTFRALGHFTGVEINSREVGLFAEGRELGPEPTYPVVLHPEAICASSCQMDTVGGNGGSSWVKTMKAQG